MALTDNLQHRWECNEPFGDFVDSVAAVNLIRQGTEVESPPGKLGLAADFITTQTHAEVAQDPSLGNQDAISVVCWVKAPEVQAGSQRIWIAVAGTGVRLRL